MKVEEIAEAIAKLPPDQLARFRRWFAAFEAGRTGHAEELDSTAIKLGRLAGRAFAHRLTGDGRLRLATLGRSRQRCQRPRDCPLPTLNDSPVRPLPGTRYELDLFKDWA
jgi:hypothetical protein